jgi:glycosyltransferase involved in cell wall biosynthesis
MTSSAPVVIYSPAQAGGVRHVTECLADGIQRNGRQAVLARTISDLVRARRQGATEAILSLEAGYVAPLFARSIYILHGMPFVDTHASWRRAAVRGAARCARWSGARLVAVSYVTRAVHERLYGIPVDAVITNGCSASFHARAEARTAASGRERWVAFVGRLIDGKGIRKIVRAFAASGLPALGYELRVAGSGPLSSWVTAEAEQCRAIRVLGAITEQAKEDLLFRSDAFVSLNDFEPMGVVFAEALLAGCKIVAPVFGGHREFLPASHPVALCDPANVESITAALDAIPSLPHPGPAPRKEFDYLRTIAPRYLEVLAER